MLNQTKNYPGYCLNYHIPLTFLSILFCGFSTGCQNTYQVNIESGNIYLSNLRCEYLNNPLGIDTTIPRLNWQIQSDKRGISQSAYQVLVASTKKNLAQNIGNLWNSGKIKSDQSIQVEYAGSPLASGQDCFWKVRVWDQDGRVSAWSKPAAWSVGLLNRHDWQAHWIGQQNPATANASKAEMIESIYPLPIFRKEFQVRSDIQNAKVYISGLGQYELFCNGKKVGTHFLDPAWSLYEKTVYCNTFDITDALKSGRNAFGVMLGKGFYNTKGDRRIHFVNVYRPLKLILQAHITYTDGSQEIITSDDSWKYTRGPLTHSAILGGSSYDARRLPTGWSKAGFDDSAWKPVEKTTGPGGELRGFTAPPMQTMTVFEPVTVDEPEPGYFVYDFGQNAAAIPRISLQGSAGRTIRLTPAEQRHGQTGAANNGKGRVNHARVGKPNYWEYTLTGKGNETWSPPFTYTGYQYIEISGAVPVGRPNPDNLPVIEKLVSVQVRNASPQAGTFDCSNQLFNDINRLIDWSVQSNMSHVLTDCPTREKLGWLETAFLMAPSILWNYDAAAFYSKAVQDIIDSQQSDGRILTVAPDYPVFDEGPFRYSPEWAAAGVFLPWQLYQWCGDRRILEQSCPMMKRYVDYMEATSDNLIAKPGLGDWYDYEPGQAPGFSKFTPQDQTATAIFYGCADTLAQTAALLGKTQDAKHYADLCSKIKTRFNEQYFDGKTEYQNNGSPQTANAMALVLGLTEPPHKNAVLQAIIDDLKRRGWQQTSGDVGYYYLLQALSDYNRNDVIYNIANRDTVGSYGYILRQGWTTMTEAWDASVNSSMNHCMLGQIQQWFQQCLVGIRPDPAAPGFKQCIIRPEPVGNITRCKGSHESPYGTIKSEWIIRNDQFILDVTIPANTTATVYLPTNSRENVLEGAYSADDASGVSFLRTEEGKAVYKVLSGRYYFRCPYHEGQ